jgi:hypothetical protein
VQGPESLPGGGGLRSCGHGPPSAVKHRLNAGSPGPGWPARNAGEGALQPRTSHAAYPGQLRLFVVRWVGSAVQGSSGHGWRG